MSLSLSHKKPSAPAPTGFSEVAKDLKSGDLMRVKPHLTAVKSYVAGLSRGMAVEQPGLPKDAELTVISKLRVADQIVRSGRPNPDLPANALVHSLADDLRDMRMSEHAVLAQTAHARQAVLLKDPTIFRPDPTEHALKALERRMGLEYQDLSHDLKLDNTAHFREIPVVDNSTRIINVISKEGLENWSKPHLGVPTYWKEHEAWKDEWIEKHLGRNRHYHGFGPRPGEQRAPVIVAVRDDGERFWIHAPTREVRNRLNHPVEHAERDQLLVDLILSSGSAEILDAATQIVPDIISKIPAEKREAWMVLELAKDNPRCVFTAFTDTGLVTAGPPPADLKKLALNDLAREFIEKVAADRLPAFIEKVTEGLEREFGSRASSYDARDIAEIRARKDAERVLLEAFQVAYARCWPKKVPERPTIQRAPWAKDFVPTYPDVVYQHQAYCLWQERVESGLPPVPVKAEAITIRVEESKPDEAEPVDDEEDEDY